jgi:hypothetical protein
MTTTGAQANGLAARRAADRGDEEYARACFRAVIRAATTLQREGKREEAALLCAAFERGHGGGSA